MGKSSEANDAAGEAALAQTRLAEGLVRQTGPLRQNLIFDAQRFLSGDRDVTNLPEFGAFKDSSEAQFGRARDSIISNTPSGGGLSSALANLEIGKASNQAQFTGALSGDEVNRGVQLATFGAAQGSSGLGSAAITQAQRAASESQQNAGKAAGSGQAGGAAAAAAITATSDARLKENIERVGTWNEHNIYRWEWNDLAKTMGIKDPALGVIAQEVMLNNPEAVFMDNGYLSVDYSRLV